MHGHGLSERQLEFRVRQIIRAEHGFYEPEIVRIEREPDRLVCLFTVEGLTGPVAKTLVLDSDGSEVLDGFVA